MSTNIMNFCFKLNDDIGRNLPFSPVVVWKNSLIVFTFEAKNQKRFTQIDKRYGCDTVASENVDSNRLNTITSKTNIR